MSDSMAKGERSEITPADIYAALDPQAQEIARAAIPHIRKLHRRAIDDAVEIGRTLIRVKEAVGHGNFRPWLETELRLSPSSAHNMMSLAERLGGKCATVEHLPLSLAYRLAAPSTPEETRKSIIERIEAGEVLRPGDISYEISESKKAESRSQREAARLAARGAGAIARDKRNRERRHQRYAREMAESKERWERSKAAGRDACAMIVNALADSEIGQLVALLHECGGIHSGQLANMRLSIGDHGMTNALAPPAAIGESTPDGAEPAKPAPETPPIELGKSAAIDPADICVAQSRSLWSQALQKIDRARQREMLADLAAQLADITAKVEIKLAGP